MLHKTGGKTKRQAQVRIGEVPAAKRLQAADPVGDGVAMDAEAIGRLIQAW